MKAAQQNLFSFCFYFYPHNINGVKKVTEIYMLKLIAVKVTFIK